MESQTKKKNCNALLERIEALKDKEKINEEEYRLMMNDLKHIFKDEIRDIKYIKVLKFDIEVNIFWDDGEEPGIMECSSGHGFSHDSTHEHSDDNPLRMFHMSKRHKKSIKILRVEPEAPMRPPVGDDYIEPRAYGQLKEKKYYQDQGGLLVLLEDDLGRSSMTTQTD
jgi:hypothetical protein